LWKTYQDHWCEHKPSATISIREPEWLKVGAWVWDNFDSVSGVSFLPYSDHSYQQAPYQDITAKEYKQWLKKTTDSVDWSLLSDYEKEDMTENTKELACTAGACEIL
jgi:ribonucleoside-diphosphate reductase alpha chain